MFPPLTTAASLVPSLDEVMEYQFFALPVEVFSVHVAPESVEVQMFPPLTTAASLVPSLDEARAYQYFPLPVEVFSVHVAPESVEVQMFPFRTTAASLVPSLDEVMEYQDFALPVGVFSVHVAPESVEPQSTWAEADSVHLARVKASLVPLNCRYLPPGGTHLGGSAASILAEIPTSPSKQYTSPSTRTFGVFKTISEYSPVVSTYTSPSWLFRVTLLNVSSLSTGFPETFVSPSKNHTAARDGPSVARARTLSRERR